MVDFELPEHTRQIGALVRRLVNDYCLPLEARFLRGEQISDQEQQAVTQAATDVGLWGLNLSESLGGAHLSTIDNVVVTEENYRTLIPIRFAGDAPFLELCVGEQRDKYLMPVVRGEKRMAFAQTEPSGGSDPGNQMQTRAVRDGDDWVLNGSKVFISGSSRADFWIVMAVTDPELRQHGGITAFLIDRGTPGFNLTRPIPIMSATGANDMYGTYEIHLDDCRIPAGQVLAGVGGGSWLRKRG